MNNLLIISVIIILFWLVAFGIYYVFSNRQVEIEKSQEKIAQQLGDDVEE